MAPKKRKKTAPKDADLPKLVEQLAGTSRARNMSRLRLGNLSFTQLLEFAVRTCESYPELKDKADALIAEVAPLASTHQDAHILRETSKLSLERKVAVAKLGHFVYENSEREEQWSRRQAVYTLLLNTRGAMQALVGLLDLENDEEVVRWAAWLLHNDCVRDSEAIKDKLVNLGAVEALVELLESKDENIAAGAAGSLGNIIIIDPTDTSRGHTRVRKVCEAGALPALDRMLANGTHLTAVTVAVDESVDNMALINTEPQTAVMASQALINMVNSGVTIEWAMLKYFAGEPDEDGVSGSPPTQFPDLMTALRELSEEFRGEANTFAARFGGRASSASGALFGALTEAIEASAELLNDRHYKAIYEAAQAIFKARDA